MCDSQNLIEFKNGAAIMSSGHMEMRGPYGTYTKDEEGWVWHMKSGEGSYDMRMYPSWFFIRVVDPNTGEKYSGHRLFWPPAIKRARANEKTPPGFKPTK